MRPQFGAGSYLHLCAVRHAFNQGVSRVLEHDKLEELFLPEVWY